MSQEITSSDARETPALWDIPRFPRGFVLATRSVPAPAGFVPGPLLENFFTHPWASVEHAGDRDLFVIVIGRCVAIDGTDETPVAAQLLSSLRRGVPEFLARTDYYGGRYAILFGSADHIRVVNDATSMRSVFYTRDGTAIASHALLAEGTYGAETAESDLPYRYGYPGNLTPYPRTKILTSNTYYCLRSNRVRRFWPVVAPAPRSSVQAAAKVLHAS